MAIDNIEVTEAMIKAAVRRFQIQRDSTRQFLFQLPLGAPPLPLRHS